MPVSLSDDIIVTEYQSAAALWTVERPETQKQLCERATHSLSGLSSAAWQPTPAWDRPPSISHLFTFFPAIYSQEKNTLCLNWRNKVHSDPTAGREFNTLKGK